MFNSACTSIRRTASPDGRLGGSRKGDRYAKGALAFPCGKIKSEKRDTRTDTSAEASRDGHKLHAARFNRARQTNQSLSLLSASPPACNGLIKLAAAAVSVGSLSAIITAVAHTFNFPRSRIGTSQDRLIGYGYSARVTDARKISRLGACRRTSTSKSIRAPSSRESRDFLVREYRKCIYAAIRALVAVAVAVVVVVVASRAFADAISLVRLSRRARA